jgi:hypothetical protein
MKTRHIHVTLALAALTTASTASAAFWNGSAGNNWNDTANWTGGNIPDTNTELAEFNANPVNRLPNLASATTVKALDFQAGAGNYTVSGAALTLDFNSLTSPYAVRIGQTGVTQVIDTNLNLTNSAAGGAAYAFSLSQASTLTLSAGRTYTTTVDDGNDHVQFSPGNVGAVINVNGTWVQSGGSFTQYQATSNGTVNWNPTGVSGNISSLRQLGTGRLNILVNQGPNLGMGGTSQTGTVGSVYLANPINYSRTVGFGLNNATANAVTYTFGSDISGGGSSTFSGTVTLVSSNATNNITYQIDAKAGNTLTLSNVISGGSVAATTAVRTIGTGTVVLSGSSANTFSTVGTNGGVFVDAGTLRLAKTGASALGSGVTKVTVAASAALQLGGTGNNQIADTVPLTLAGKLDTAGLSETFGNLTLSGSPVIDFGSLNSTVVTFASLTNATLASLTIDNWSGSGAGGGADQLKFTSVANWTPANLAAVTFTGFAPGAVIVNGDELVPAALVPEPGSIAVLLTSGIVLLRRGRKL